MRIGQNRFLGAIHMLLSDLAIRRAKPKEKAYTLNDGNGLSLLIEPNGSKGWRLRYRFAGKPKMLSLGVYPEVSLSDARTARDEAKRLIAGGVNPSEVRKAQKREQANKCGNLMNPLMILVKIIKLRWIHILSYDQMVSRKINNQTTRCANSIFYTTLFTNSAPNYT